MATIIPTDMFERWWRKAQFWAATQFTSVLMALHNTDVAATANKDEILAAIPQECSDADIDRMFEVSGEDGLIIVPPGLIGDDGSMPIGVFSAVTGLTPV